MEHPFENHPFDVEVRSHKSWSIEATPLRTGQKWEAACVATRAASEGEDSGDKFSFTDLGHYDTVNEAAHRAIQWTLKWIELNY